ncbi:hypothetical protein [Salinisphaera aquimarina]|uniref:Uncharacterized protein n=1 Tax=Salinisphaera aquimarina TaxID=2094031 RepID=A0ABV7ENF8_9GAMM
MILACIVFIGLLALIVAALRLNSAVERASQRFRVLVGGYGEAGALLDARQRFRRRQQSVEKAVDTGTAGVQSAHRTLSGLWGGDRERGTNIYAGVRAFNRNIGRTVSGLFAPGPKKHSESLEEWRRANDAKHDD